MDDKPTAPAKLSALNWRQAAVFGGGLALGAAAVWFAMDSRNAGLHRDAAAARTPEPAPVVAARAGPSPAIARAVTPCPAHPVVTASPGGKDGHFEMPANMSANRANDVGNFIVIGKEAAAGARPRDAEVAFLMACKVAARLTAAGSIESADARYQLARHYALVSGPADARNPPPAREQMLQRSQSLYADSAESYVAKLGPVHEKTRHAAEGLAAVRDLATGVPPTVVAQAIPVPAPIPSAKAAAAPPPAAKPAPAPRPAPVAKAAPVPPARPAPAVARKTAPPTDAARRDAAAPARVQPSFDCSRARSVPEHLICDDPHLAQLDRELGRLHARARGVAPDTAAFTRDSDQAWRRREATCRDRDCVLRWYASRRNQLLDELEESQAFTSYR